MLIAVLQLCYSLDLFSLFKDNTFLYTKVNEIQYVVLDQAAGSSVHNVLKILNSRLGSEGNIKDTKDVAYVSVYVSVSCCAINH